MKFIFIGQSSKFSCHILDTLLNSEHELIGVIESAPRNVISEAQEKRLRLKRKLKFFLRKRYLSSYARSKKVPYFLYTKHKSNELTRFLKQLNPEIVCVASMSQLIPPESLIELKYGFINLHPSLLPKYRGANPYFWHYYYMEKEGGVTVHKIDRGEDTGDIIQQESFPIELGMDPKEIISKAAEVGARNMLEAINKISLGTATFRTQKNLPCLYKGRRIKPGENIYIDWENWSIERIYHILSGGYLWYDPLPQPKGLWKIFKIRAISFSRQSTQAPYGVIQRDRQGFYLSHPEGRISLKWVFFKR
ncbi:methionyl-tRNA formyltransferase [Picosynechococcus sp. PCC 11901]|uniref:methionyl-tRNA formyltransferase n=1 Tax=Picosynechococcus sp. PCC 11901 TaxID=2579791 RepID=UPI0010FC2FC9|nr:formyltransferase family protein [Picosynechococcus sp. PCC 11901]QCS49050.1 methionyl-tRNA formyltransferase [Picosynechococcus sp. PCC 11901]